MFGEGPDLYISSNANTNKLSKSILGKSYHFPKGKWPRYFLAGKPNFSPNEIEVYYEKRKRN